MTCDECKATLETHPVLVTRAIRAAMIAHLMKCQPCKDALDEGKAEERAKYGVPPPEHDALVDAMHAEDIRDPEFRAVTEGQS